MCTSVFYQNKQLDYFLARTMDFSLVLDGRPIFIPQNYTFYQKDSTKAFETKYGFIGAGRFAKEYLFVDGINECGLAVASLYFSDNADYVDKQASGKKVLLLMT